MDIVKELLDFIDTAFPEELPKWATENEIVYSTSALKLRYFGGYGGVPTLVLPPQAGHSSHIADYDKGQSIVETIVANRTSPVYCVEWLSATQERKFEGIKDLVEQVNSIVNFVGEKVHIVGLCQGGWLSAIYAALHNNKVESLTCIAAPIDFHSGGGVIYDTVSSLGMMPYRMFVMLNNGVMTGENMLFGWKMMNALDRYVNDYLKIAMSIDDFNELQRIKKFRTWYEHTQDLSGSWYLEAVENLFLENKLVKGELVLGGKPVNLGDIKCTTVMIAGERDDITLPSHIFALGDYIDTKHSCKYTIPKAGHVGCFMGRNSQKYIKESIMYIDNTTK